MAESERLILAFGPPLAGYALLRIAFWVRPVTQRVPKAESDLKSFLVYSLRDEASAGKEIRAGASMRASAGR
jgi:hypothetical protein